MKTFYTLILAATMLLATGEAMAKKKPAKKKHKHTIHVHHRMHRNVRMTKGGIVKHTTVVTDTEVKPAGSAQTGTIHQNVRVTTGGVQKRSSN